MADDVKVVPREGLVGTLSRLRDSGYRMPLDVTCVDRSRLPGAEGPRFEVVYHLRSMPGGDAVRVKVPVEESDPVVPTATGVFKGLSWFEREVFDMFGVRFEGHPDMRRILLYPEFVGHPLRKDYPRRGYQPLMDMPRIDGEEVPAPPGPRPAASTPPPAAPDGMGRARGGGDQIMTINMGPSHPAMHGTVRMRVRLDGETVVSADPDIGFLHRGFEKMCEAGTWTKVIPFTDRLNYVSPLINNVGYCGAVERMLGVDPTERCKYVRVFCSEIARITDHLTAVGASALEIGAFTPFLWAMQAREEIYYLIEFVTGARVTTSYTRIGGLRWDLPDGWQDRWLACEGRLLRLMDDISALLTRNRIFIDRMADVGAIPGDDAIAWGWTGPCLRSAGVDWDLRKARPYLVYDRMEFDVPVGRNGDNYDRYLVRMEEIRQSVRIVRQVIRDIPDGPVNVDDWGVVLPPKDAAYNTIEG
ncbi:MAG: NADH-quinone oxidoreductase subunit D, partial [Deltaproteobacteria bacterium]|nr:NADH-quinone oxidoreductase subunit D [Deltaproteobacteria bacterium]